MTTLMKYLSKIFLAFLLICPNAHAKDFAYRFPSKTPLEVLTPVSYSSYLDSIYIRQDGTSTTSAIIPFASGISVLESGQDTFLIDKAAGLFRLRNSTDGRNELTIDGTGLWTVIAANGFYVSGAAFFTSSTDFRGTTTVADNILFNIGDGSGQLGNAQLYMDTINGYVILDTSNVELLASGYGLVMKGGAVGINPAGTVFTSFPAVMIGPTVSGAGAAPNSMLHVGKQTPSSSATGTIAANVALDYINATNTSAQFNAMNQTFRYNSPNNLTSATVAGASGGRARFITGSSGTGRVTLGAGMSIGITGSTSTATLGTDIFGLYGEVNAIAGAQFDRTGHAYFRNFSAPTGSGFITNLYGSRYEQLTRGTNNYEIALEDAGRVWFRVPTSSTAATEYIYSSAASTLDDNANTTRNFRIGGTVELALTTSTLTLKEALNIVAGTTTGTKIGTATTQKLGFYNATPIVQPTDGATLTNNVTSGGTTDTIANYTDLVIYANDAAAIRNDIYQLARKVKIITDNLRALGLAS